MATQTTHTRSIDGIHRKSAATTRPSRQKKFKVFVTRNKWTVLAVAAVLVAIVAIFGSLALMRKHSAKSYGDDVNSVKARVSAHYLLPTDEEPALATVTDKSKLTTPFLKHAENGDRLLIYQKNHIAIIYRPSIDRIVNVGPVSIDEPPTASKDNTTN